jgi:hypothetical protein
VRRVEVRVVKAAVVIADLQIWVGGVAEILESQDARHAIDARVNRRGIERPPESRQLFLEADSRGDDLPRKSWGRRTSPSHFRVGIVMMRSGTGFGSSHADIPHDVRMTVPTWPMCTPEDVSLRLQTVILELIAESSLRHEDSRDA